MDLLLKSHSRPKGAVLAPTGAQSINLSAAGRWRDWTASKRKHVNADQCNAAAQSAAPPPEKLDLSLLYRSPVLVCLFCSTLPCLLHTLSELASNLHRAVSGASLIPDRQCLWVRRLVRLSSLPGRAPYWFFRLCSLAFTPVTCVTLCCAILRFTAFAIKFHCPTALLGCPATLCVAVSCTFRSQEIPFATDMFEPKPCLQEPAAELAEHEDGGRVSVGAH